MFSSSRNRILAGALLAATFLVGLVAGVVLDRAALSRRERMGPPRGGLVTEVALRRLDRELDLTSVQEEQVRAILERRRETIDRLRRELRPRIREEMEATGREIEQVLTPDQQKEFRRLRETMRHRQRRGPRPDRG